MKMKASKSQRECKLKTFTSCETCEENDDCPFLYCQHIDCLMCNQRFMCPMCEGDCKKCQHSTVCKVQWGK